MNTYLILVIAIAMIGLVLGVATTAEANQSELTLVPTAVLRDGEGGFYALYGPGEIKTFIIDGQTYALVATHGENAIQIMDITNPNKPVPVSTIRDFGVLASIEVFVLSNQPFVIVSTYQSWSTLLFDISDPANPIQLTPMRLLDAESNTSVMGYPNGGLQGTFTIADRTYVIMNLDQGLVVFDITNPLVYTEVSNWGWSSGILSPFETFEVSGRTYTLMVNDGIQKVVDITDPADPTEVSDSMHPQDGFGIHGYIASIEWQKRTYLFRFTDDYYSHGIYVIDVTNPSSPTPVTEIHVTNRTPTTRIDTIYNTHEEFGYLSNTVHFEIFEGQGRTYALAVNENHKTHIMDITDPTSIRLVGSVDENLENSGAYNYKHAVEVSDRTYVLSTSDAVYVMELVDTGLPLPQPMQISNLQVDGHQGRISTGDFVHLSAELENRQLWEQEFVFLIQVRHPSGDTENIGWVTGSLEFGEMIGLTASFAPPTIGTYTVTVLAESTDDMPPLAIPISTDIRVE